MLIAMVTKTQNSIVLVRSTFFPFSRRCGGSLQPCTNFRDDAYLSKAGIPVDVGIVLDLLTQPFPPMSSITII